MLQHLQQSYSHTYLIWLRTSKCKKVLKSYEKILDLRKKDISLHCQWDDRHWVRLNGEQIPLNSSRCEGMMFRRCRKRREHHKKFLSGEHLTFEDIFEGYQRRTASNGRCGQMGTKFVLSVLFRELRWFKFTSFNQLVSNCSNGLYWVAQKLHLRGPIPRLLTI